MTLIQKYFLMKKYIYNHCIEYYEKVDRQKKNNKNSDNSLNQLIEEIKSKKRNNRYDCVIGVSGGVDSSYVALLAKQKKLKALLVHFDNGWNSEISVQNVKNIAKNTNFDLITDISVDSEDAFYTKLNPV